MIWCEIMTQMVTVLFPSAHTHIWTPIIVRTCIFREKEGERTLSVLISQALTRFHLTKAIMTKRLTLQMEMDTRGVCWPPTLVLILPCPLLLFLSFPPVLSSHPQSEGLLAQQVFDAGSFWRVFKMLLKQSVVKPKERKVCHNSQTSQVVESSLLKFSCFFMFFKKEPGKSFFSRVSRGNFGETNKPREHMIFLLFYEMLDWISLDVFLLPPGFCVIFTPFSSKYCIAKNLLGECKCIDSGRMKLAITVHTLIAFPLNFFH